MHHRRYAYELLACAADRARRSAVVDTDINDAPYAYELLARA